MRLQLDRWSTTIRRQNSVVDATREIILREIGEKNEKTLVLYRRFRLHMHRG